jgi:hypothetical protein
LQNEVDYPRIALRPTSANAPIATSPDSIANCRGMTRNIYSILVTALVAVLVFVIFRQQGVINSVRLGTALPFEPIQTTPEPAEVPAPVSSPADGEPTPTAALASHVIVTQVSFVTVSNASSASRDEQDNLQAEIQRLETDLRRTKQLVPEPEDAKTAYVGAGTWVNVNPQTLGITKIEISAVPAPGRRFGNMTINAWGKCHPTDCAWPEVPFYLLDRRDGPNKYKRGFAAWERENGIATYLLITFENSGLRIDRVELHAGQDTRFSTVESMMRIN